MKKSEWYEKMRTVIVELNVLRMTSGASMGDSVNVSLVSLKTNSIKKPIDTE